MGSQLAAVALASTLSASGFGPFTIGMSFDQVKSAAEGQLKVDPIVPGSTCRYVIPNATPGLRLMIDNGKLLRIEVVRGSIASDRGVRIGDASARIAKAYGAANVRVEPNKYDPKASDVTVVPRDPALRDRRLI